MPGETLIARLLIAAGTALLLLAIGAYGGCSYKQHAWDAAVAAQEKQAQATKAQQDQLSEPIEVRYVDRIKEVKVPVVQIRDRLVRSCPAGSVHDGGPADGGTGASGSAGKPTDDATAADADDGLLGKVAGEIPNCVANGIQLGELQALICANADQKIVARLIRAGRLKCGK